MKLKEAFNELNTLYENANTLNEVSEFNDRHILIANIQSTGRNYKFDKWSDTQLYRMWQRIQKEEHDKKIARKMLDDFAKAKSIKRCPECGTQLSDNGTCHICDTDYGWEERLDEGVFDSMPSNKANWISMKTGKTIPPRNAAANNQQKPNVVGSIFYAISDIGIPGRNKQYYYWDNAYEIGTIEEAAANGGVFKRLQDTIAEAKDIFTLTGVNEVFIMSIDIINMDIKLVKSIKNAVFDKKIVTIVDDGGRLRAQADDGLHGKGFVVFPKNLRNFEGQQYEVENLTWTGKNYRASGSITEITNSNQTNALRYCVATVENPKLSDGDFFWCNIHKAHDGSNYRKFGLDTFYTLDDHYDFDDNITDAKNRVKDIMRQYPNEDLHILSVDNKNNLKVVLSFV